MNTLQQTILIVDDTPENIDILKNILHDTYKIKAAVNGERALKVAQSDPKPDMILLDIMMPDMDGYEVCRRLKADPATAEIPVIFVTAMNSEEDEEKGLALGALDYITKPISPAITKARIKTHLSMQCLFERKHRYEQRMFEDYRTKSINELMVNISHHWRQPLNIIAVDVENIRMDMEDEGIVSESITQALESIKKTTHELSSVIDFFKKYRPQPDAPLTPFSPRDLIHDITSLAREKIDASSLEVINAIPEELTVTADAPILLNVLLTLLENTVDVAQERKIADPVITFEAEADTKGLLIRVSDNAGGIDVEPRERIFDPYFTTFFKSKDKGLGLYMAKIGVEEHLDGSIEVQNSQEGACFTLRITDKASTV